MVEKNMGKVFGQPLYANWAVPVVASFFMGITGPFGSYEAIETIPRFLFWSAVCWFYFALLLIAARLVERWAHSFSLTVRRIILVIGITTVGAPFVCEFAHIAYGEHLHTAESYIRCWWQSFGIILAVATIDALVLDSTEEPPAAPIRPKFFDRLSLATQNDDVVCLSADNHHVVVVMQSGATERILIRLSDAVAEMDGVDGFMIHRSHWVCAACARSGLRRGGKDLLVLSTGAELPVSAKYKPVLEAAGFVFQVRKLELQ